MEHFALLQKIIGYFIPILYWVVPLKYKGHKHNVIR